MYLPFLISVILIATRKQIINYEDFIITNALWLIFIVTPLIIFKNYIGSFKGSTANISQDRLIDTSKYDDEGNLIKGERRILSKEEREIKERAAESEYNERINIDKGIYN